MSFKLKKIYLNFQDKSKPSRVDLYLRNIIIQLIQLRASLQIIMIPPEEQQN